MITTAIKHPQVDIKTSILDLVKAYFASCQRCHQTLSLTSVLNSDDKLSLMPNIEPTVDLQVLGLVGFLTCASQRSN